MRISELCGAAGISILCGGQDRYGHEYQPDEYHFDFEIGLQLVLLRYRPALRGGTWFVNRIFPGGRKASITSTQISEMDVMQVLVFYLWLTLRAEPAHATHPA